MARRALVGLTLAALVATTWSGGSPAYAEALPSKASPPAAVAAVAKPHRAYVVKVTNQGDYGFTDAQLQRGVRSALARWVVESNGAIPDFSLVEFKTATSTGTCLTGGNLYNQFDDELFPGVAFGNDSGNHLIVMQPMGCGGGVGTVGDSIADGGKLSFDFNGNKGLNTLLHELGHNFGLSHAQSTCSDGTCEANEYGNYYTPMGATHLRMPAYVPGSFTTFERNKLDILSTCEAPTVALAPGRQTLTATYDLAGRGTERGSRGLTVDDPQSDKTYWLDFRNGAGRDAQAYYAGTTTDPASNVKIGVTVEEQDSGSGATRLLLRSVPGSDVVRRAYQTGQTFERGGVRVQVGQSVGTGADQLAQVTVTLGDPDASAGPALTPLQGGVQIKGLAAIGATLTAQTAGWTGGTCFGYQWLDNGRPIPGARFSTYAVPPSARGHRISVAVLGQRTGFQPRRVASPAVLAGRFKAVRPGIKGQVRVGGTLKAVTHLGRWSPRPTKASYRWFAGKKKIRGASKARISVTRAMRGKKIRVVVRGTRNGFAPISASSKPTSSVR